MPPQPKPQDFTPFPDDSQDFTPFPVDSSGDFAPVGENNAVAETKMSPQQYSSLGFLDKLKASWRGQNPGAGQEAVDPTFDNPMFTGVAAVGKKLAGSIHKYSGEMAEAGGRTIGPLATNTMIVPVLGAAETATDMLVPQTKESAGLSFIGGMKPSPSQALSTESAPAQAAKVKMPGPIDKLAGGLISTTTRVPERFASAVVADPTILSPETPDIGTAGKAMGDYLASKGTKIDSQTLNQITGKRFFPSDNQVESLRKTLLDPVLDKIEARAYNPNLPAPTEEEVILAERAANAVTRSSAAHGNPTLMGYARGAQKALIGHLESLGYGELPGLKRDYFRALAKDAFTDVLPQNKAGSPNALSSLLMLKKAKDAVSAFAGGSPVEAAGHALGAAAFSPLAVGTAIRAASAGVAPAASQGLVRSALLASPAGPVIKQRSQNEGGR